MNVRAKVVCESVQEFDTYFNGEKVKGANVSLRPVYDDAPENKTWSAATPSGHFQMGITNPDAAAAFEQGKLYFVDFTPA